MLSLPDSLDEGDSGKSHSISKIDNPRDCCMICSKIKNYQTTEILISHEQPRSDFFPKTSTMDTDSTYCNKHYLDKIKKYNQIVRPIKDFLELEKNSYKEVLLSETILKSKVLLMGTVCLMDPQLFEQIGMEMCKLICI